MELRAYRPEDCPAMGALFYDTVHTVCTGSTTPASWTPGRRRRGWTWRPGMRAFPPT